MINIVYILGVLAADWQQLSVRLLVMVLHSLWQGAAIGLLLAIALRVIRADASRTRYAAACIAFACVPLLAMVTFCVVDVSPTISETAPPHQSMVSLSKEETALHSSLVSSMPAGVEPFQYDGKSDRSTAAGSMPLVPPRQQSKSIEITSPNTNLLAAIRPLAPWLSALYASGAVLMLLRTFVAIRSGHRLQRSARPIQETDLVAVVAKLAAKLGLKMAPVVAYCQQVAVPVVVGVLKPTILLPASLVTYLTPDELAAILSHELAHIRRYDLIVNLLQRIVESLLFFHPVVWWISRQVANERENCCDDLAAAEGVGRLQYASALLQMAELCLPLRGRHFSHQLVAVSAEGTSSSQFSRRIERLLKMHGTPQLAVSRILSVSCVFAVVLTGATVGVLAQRGHDADRSEHVADSTANNVQNEDAVRETSDVAEPTLAAKPISKSNDDPVEISGRIVLEDGSAATTKGYMHYRCEQSNGNGVDALAGQFTDDFSLEAPEGTIWLLYFADGFAPAWAGPIRLKPGQKLDDVTIVLKSGFSVTVKVANEQGEPVSGATLVAYPEIGGQTGGPFRERVTNLQGGCLLKNMADTKYGLQISAPGYQPLRTKAMKIAPDFTLVQTLIRSELTTGVVLNADGKPAAGAKLRATTEIPQDGSFIGLGDSSPGRWGKDFATTDDNGRFTVDQLSSDSHYLFTLETADGARAIVGNIRAGQKSIQLKVPGRRDLHVTILGDTSKLFRRNGKPFVSIRQRVGIDVAPDRQYGDLIGDDVPVELTDDGGTVDFHGLAVDLNPGSSPQQVEVKLDSMTKTVALNLEGVTQVEFQLPDRLDAQARKPDSPVISEFPFKVKFEQGTTSFLKGDKITILEVRGTAETFAPGNIYWVKGTYTLSSNDRATLGAYITAADAKNAKSATLKVQTTPVDQGDGTFTLFLPMSCKGWPHVSFYPAGGGESFGGNYVGTGDSVLKTAR